MSPTSRSLFLEIGQRVRLEKAVNVRDAFDFRKDAPARFTGIPSGTELKVLDTKRLPSGNYGVQVEYPTPRGPRKGWLYYQPQAPGLAVLNENGTQVAMGEEEPDLELSATQLPPKIGNQQVQMPAESSGEDMVEASLRRVAELSVRMRGEAPRPPGKVESFRGYPVAERAVFFQPRLAPESCERKSIRDRFGDVRNQDGLGWCFAYAASDLLSFYMGKNPSPFELSLRYFQRDEISPGAANAMRSGAGPTNVAGGNLGAALKLAQGEGICLERDVPSTDFLQSYLSSLPDGDPLRGYLLRLGDSERFDWLANVVRKVESFQEGQRGDILRNPTLTCDTALAANLLFPRLGMDEVLAALRSGKSKAEVFNWLAYLTCPNKERLPPGFVVDGAVVKGKNKGNRFLPKLDELLDKGEPVAITYDVRPFYRDPNRNGTDDSSLHISLVVGREFRHGKCQYLIRNTWGPSCAGYSRPCDRGHFWISEEDFHQHVEQIEYLRKQ